MNVQFPVPLNTNRLTAQEIKDMPEWFKVPLDFINKIAQTVYYAQEAGDRVSVLEAEISKMREELDALGA